MKRRIIGALLLIGSISGCISTSEPETGGMRANYGRSFGPPSVPGVSGPYGEKIPMAAPYNTAPPASQWAALKMMDQNIPLNAVQMNPPGTPRAGPPGMGMPPMLMPPGGIISPPGMPFAPGAPSGSPFQKTGANGMMPDTDLVNANIPPGAKQPAGVMPAQFAGNSPIGSMFPAQRTQVFFSEPAGMKIYWFTQGADGKPNFSTTPLETPGRYNFAQAAIYRLKLTRVPGRPALELYPTLEVVPTSPKTNEFLAHNSVPVEFTDEDFKQVVERNYIVKVIYLPDPQFQDAAGAGPQVISTRLDPGQDPIQEALRRGSILLVLRIGNIDQGLQHSPGMTAPVPGGPPALMKPPGQGVAPFFQVPFPVPPITPGGVGTVPNTLSPLPGANPPALVVPTPPVVMPDVVPAPKNDEAVRPEVAPAPKKGKPNKLFVPPVNLPAPPGFKLDDGVKPNVPAIPPLPPALTPSNNKPPVPPAPSPTGKDDKGTSGSNVGPAPKTPVIPASTNQESGSQLPSVTLPSLPPIDSSVATVPDLPTIPTLPVGGKK
jgi:hypothetical protein